MRWDQGVPCPCRSQLSVGYTLAQSQSVDTYESNATCAGCNGTGVLFVDSQEILGVLSQFGEANKFAQAFGRLRPGECHLTLLPEHIPDMDDRFTMLDRTITMSETLRRDGDTSRLRFPIATKVVELGNEYDPTILEKKELRVLGLWVADTDGTYTPRPSLVEGVDFEVVDGAIDWTLGDALETAPAEGTPFSVRYYANPVYKVTELARVCRDTQIFVSGEEQHGSGPVAIIVAPMYRGFRPVEEA